MEAATNQTSQVSDYFRGPSGRLHYQRLVYFAYKKTVRARFNDPSVVVQPPEHYVNEAIKRCLPGADGQAARDLDRALPLEVMFKGIIESVISHDVYPSETRMLVRGVFGVTGEDDKQRDLTADDFERSMWNDNRGDEEIRKKAIRRLDESPVIDAFKSYIRRDETVYRMVLLSLDEDIDEPAKLVAKRLGITVQEVYATRRRLERFCRQFAQEGRN